MIKHHVQSTNMEMTPAISDYLNKKISALEKFVKEESEAIARIEVGRTTNHHHKGEVFIAEINLDLEGNTFTAVSESDDLYHAIDQMKENIVSEVIRTQKKKRHLLRRGHQKIKALIKKLRR